jgi:methylglyoxal synthase
MDSSRNMQPVKRIALVAHDNKKADLLDWATYNKRVLTRHQLIATGTTGSLLEKIIGTPVKRLLSGPLGGDQQLGAMIAEGKLDIILFFWDPMMAQAHDSDVKALLRIAVAWNIVIACNRSTADFVLTSLLMEEEHAVSIPDYSKYRNRVIE